MVVHSKVTLRGYTLYVITEDDFKTAKFVDPYRQLKEVATVEYPLEIRHDPYDRNEYNKKVARIVLQDYDAQHRMVELKVVLKPGLDLSPQEIKAGVGIDQLDRRGEKSDEEAPKRRRRGG